MVMYSSANRGCIVPAYNLPPVPGTPAGSPNFTAGPQQPLDGWAPILDRDHFVSSPDTSTNTVFYCPDTYDIEGVASGQTGTDPGKPRGWTDWPMLFPVTGGDGGAKVAVTIPSLGFNKIIRVSYWMNAYNPVGGAPGSIPTADIYYSTSVGLGPDPNGLFLRLHKTSSIHHSAQLVTVADGVYMGRQSVDQAGMNNSRVGFRHPGPAGRNTSANAAFADGHAESLRSDLFPCSLATTSSYTTNLGHTTLAQQLATNANSYTVYANPALVISSYLSANPGAN
jgi:prepilin-type processing-associated H-X9-DG protein